VSSAVPAPRRRSRQEQETAPSANDPTPWDTSCLDWRTRILAGRSLMPHLPLQRAAARRAVAIFDKLCLPDVPGRPVLAEAGGSWQREIVAALAGSWDPAARVRHLRELFLLVPKKNNKTTGGAAAMVTMLLMNARPRAEFLFIAPTHEISELAFAQAVGMIENDPVLLSKCKVQAHRKQITFIPTGAFLKVKSFDPKIVTGSKPCGVLLDELHVIAEAPEADRVIGQLRGGLVSQPEGFLFTITTQSERAPSGVFLAELTKARAVRDGRLRAPLLPILYEFPEGVDWREPKNWKYVTPNEGRSVSVSRLIPDFEAAIVAGDAELRRWASQHLNVQIGTLMLTDHWPGAAFWDECADAALADLDELLARCELFTVGIDAGGPEDWLGLAVLGREEGTRRWLAWSHAWVHEKALTKYKGEAQRWGDFAAAHELSIVPKLGPDVQELTALVAKVYETGKLYRVGLDPAGSAKVLHEALLTDAGLPQALFVGISQGWRLVGVIKLVERRLAEGSLLHSGTGLMSYCCTNARVESRGNATLITKEVSKGKIDPLMALLDAAECMAVAPAPVDVDSLIAPA